MIKIYQRQQNRNGISPSDPIDPIHKIISIRDSHTNDKSQEYNPPTLPIENTKLIEHQEHRRKLRHQTHTIRQ